MSTPYMNLILPVVGPLGTQGPDWANEINTALTLIDQHDHSSGLGKQITPAGININQTLQMNSQQLSEIASLALDNLSSQPASANLIYEYAGELYFNDANANQVQLTSGGTINVASVGTISGDYGGSNPANVSFSNITDTYLFTKAPGVTGSIACGPVSIYQNASGSYYAKLQQNVAQASNLDWTLPVDYPATKLPLKSSASGVLETSQIVTSEIADAQVTAVKLATDSVETAKIVNQAVTAAKIANNTITTNQISNSAGITGAQIATGTITSSNIQDGTITTVDINNNAGIERSKLVSQTLISNFGGTTISSSFSTIGNITFIPYSYHVMVCIKPSFASEGYAQLQCTNSTVAYGQVRILLNGNHYHTTRVGGNIDNGQPYYYALGGFTTVVSPTIGVSNNIAVQIAVVSSFGTPTFSIAQARIEIIEL